MLAKGYRPTKKPPTTAVDLHAYFWLCLNDENAVPSDETLDSLILAIEAEARAEGRREFAPLVNREHEKHAAAEAALAESRAPLDVELRDAVQAHIDWLYRQPGARRFTLTDLRAAIAREYAKE